jgi:hypothetical protein
MASESDYSEDYDDDFYSEYDDYLIRAEKYEKKLDLDKAGAPRGAYTQSEERVKRNTENLLSKGFKRMGT